MKSLKAVIVLASVLVLASVSAQAAPEVYKIDAVHSHVGFTIRHLVSKVPGHFNTFSGEITFDRENPAASRVSAEIDATSIDTANENRDKHLKSDDFFKTEKHPKITFTSTGVSPAGKERASVTGSLTMAGVTKPVTLEVTALGFAPNPFGPGERAGFEAKTKLNRKDFGIVWNKALDAGGAVLGDEVEITLLVEAATAASAPKPSPAAKSGSN